MASSRRSVPLGRLSGAFLAAGALGLAAISVDAGSREAHVLAAHATGAAHITDSRGGQAIVSAARMGPGSSVSGTVTITNTGDAPGAVFLSKSGLSDTPGAGGGVLSSKLVLKVEELPALTEVYRGSLGAMTERSLGTTAPGAQRTYRFTLTLPHGTGDNDYRDASASVNFDWGANTAVSEPEPPTTTDPPLPPSTVTTPPPTATTPPTPPPAGDTTPPRLTLVPGRAQRMKKGAVTITAKCDEPCRIVAVSRGAKASPATELAAGTAVKLKITLSKKDVKALTKAIKKRKKGSVALAITARDRAGNAGAANVKVALKR